MLRLPRFSLVSPASAREAAALAAGRGNQAMLVAGGTDLFPKMKRRQFHPELLVSLARIPGLRGIRRQEGWVEIGAGTTLSEVSASGELRGSVSGYCESAELVSSPPLRHAGTIGGNLCVDTRCNYYDMTQEWRRSVGFCMKKDGDICLVAPGSPRCWAVSSSDTAPMAMALGGVVTLAGPDGDRELPVDALYRDDGMDHLTKQPHEVLTSLRLPTDPDVRSAYVKLRRRGTIDFPIAGAGVALRMDGDTVIEAAIVLSAVGSLPVRATEASRFLAGRTLDRETVMEASDLAARPARPLDNTDLTHFWRKRMVRVVVEDALLRAGGHRG